MNNLTPDNYYADKERISNSEVRNFVSYNEYGERTITSDDYYALHILGEKKEFSNPDIITVGKVVDEYFEKGPSVLEEYKVVARRSGDDPKELTKGMKESIDGMIEKGLNFKRFMDILKTPGTKSQEILLGSITNSDGEVIFIKGKPDFINRDKKLIVDLKTTESLGNLKKDLSFKGKVNINAGYVRQLAFYNYMAGGDFTGQLAVVTPTCRDLITISNAVLKKSWIQLEKDIKELYEFKTTKVFPETILDLNELTENNSDEFIL